VNAKSPNAVFGAAVGFKCRAYTVIAKDQMSRNIADMILASVQGYFSARNTDDRGDHPLTVGGSLSPDTLQAMLVDEQRGELPGLPRLLFSRGAIRKVEGEGSLAVPRRNLESLTGST
jgi:hypothetical protein